MLGFLANRVPRIRQTRFHLSRDLVAESGDSWRATRAPRAGLRATSREATRPGPAARSRSTFDARLQYTYTLLLYPRVSSCEQHGAISK